VVVANRQVRTLSTDVRKVFNAIAFSIELVDLKASPNWSIRNYFLMINIFWLLKRKQVKIPVHGEECMWKKGQTFFCVHSIWICKGDLNKHYDGNMNPIQSYLFCIKAF